MDTKVEIQGKLNPFEEQTFSYRINRFLAQANLGSRRKVEALIREGRVCVNGQIIKEFKQRISFKDEVLVDGKVVNFSSQTSYYILNKPKGYVVSRVSQKGQKTIYSLLPPTLQELKYAGRLDKESRGLVILSNDGDFIHSITHARYRVPKRYQVMINCLPEDNLPKILCRGVQYQDLFLKAAQVRVLSKKKKLIEIVLFSGKKRHIRYMLRSLGIGVLDLYRFSVGSLNLNQLSLKEKEYRAFSVSEFFA